MVPKTCSIPECERTSLTRGMCRKHYERVRRTGDAGPAGALPKLWMNPCRVAGCKNIVGMKAAKGMCSKHYQMFLKTGDPLGTTAPPAIPAIDRFNNMVVRTAKCWLWTGSMDGNGYGMFADQGRTFRAHRWMYEHAVAPIGEGLVLDHLCRTPSCVNPAHLEPVTNDENLERGWGRRIKNGWINNCINGHEYTSENTYVNPKGRLVCRACSHESRRRYEQRKAA